MITRSASGREVTLSAGDYGVRIVTVGTSLAGLRCRRHRLVTSYAVNGYPPGYLGKVLMPWPDCVTGGSYPWKGNSYDLPVNEPAYGTVPHGFMAFQERDIAEADPFSVLLRALIAARYSYPWMLLAHACYSLDANVDLIVELSAANIGENTVPCGVGFYPYLAVDGLPVGGSELENSVLIIYEADASMIPVAVHDAASFGLNLRSPAIISASRLDHASAGLPKGTWVMTLRSPFSSAGVSLFSDMRWLQVHLADHTDRVGMAVEPISCPPNAFNSDADVIALNADETHTPNARTFGFES